MQTARRFLGPCCALVILLATVALVGCGQSAEDGQDNTDRSVGGENASLAKGQTDSSQADRRRHPVVKIETSLGDIVVKLDAEKAQLTVNNFLQYVHQRHYDGTIFRDVAPEYAIVGGAYTKDLAKKPTGIPVYNEARNGLTNLPGTIAMAREPDMIDSATSGFFINLAKNAHMDHRDDTPEGYGYCVFGRVVEGMEVAKRIGNAEVHKAAGKDGSPFERVPVEPVVIKSIRVVR